MTVKFYMDEHVPWPITKGLRDRGVDVLTVQEDDHETAADEVVLDRATKLGRVLFTWDRDFCSIAVARQAGDEPFSGVITTTPGKASYRQCIDSLELISQCCEPDEWANKVSWLPIF